MKKTTSKFLSLALAFVLIVTPVFSTFGNALEYEIDCPYIFIHGFMATELYEDPDDENSNTVWPPEGDAIKTAVFELLPKLFKFLITRNHQQFGKEILPIADKLFSPAYLDDNGNVPNKSGVRFTYPSADSITKKSQLSFIYDWRVDPIETAEKLNNFIDYVLECSKSEQVVIECHSFGGVIANTYAKIYGTSKVKSWCFNSAAVYGETYTGELMLGKMMFDADAVTTYLRGAFAYNKNAKLLNGLFDALNFLGITDTLCKMFNHLLLQIGPDIICDALLPMFGRWLSVWAMVPDDMIDDAYNYVFNEVYKDSTVDRSGLKDKINNFNTDIRPYKTEMMNKINETSNLYIVGRYGFSAFFLTPSWQNSSDMIIDTKYNTFGATAADYGKTLSDEELKNVNAKYISPDKTLNTSTCMFPEQTWCIKNLTHGTLPSDLRQFTKMLLYYDGQATVDTFKDYPGFLYYNGITQTIVKDN